MIDWYSRSWFSNGDHPAKLVFPFNGYVAPPLDGVWITAPYFHNGSVPTIEAVLNSKFVPIFGQETLSREPILGIKQNMITRNWVGNFKHLPLRK